MIEADHRGGRFSAIGGTGGGELFSVSSALVVHRFGAERLAVEGRAHRQAGQ